MLAIGNSVERYGCSAAGCWTPQCSSASMVEARCEASACVCSASTAIHATAGQPESGRNPQTRSKRASSPSRMHAAVKLSRRWGRSMIQSSRRSCQPAGRERRSVRNTASHPTRSSKSSALSTLPLQFRVVARRIEAHRRLFRASYHRRRRASIATAVIKSNILEQVFHKRLRLSTPMVGLSTAGGCSGRRREARQSGVTIHAPDI